MYTRRAWIHFAFAVTVLGLPSPRISHAQGADYPAAGRYITAVCMFAPGSGADIFVRFYARKLQELAGSDGCCREQGRNGRKHRHRVCRQIEAGRLHDLDRARELYSRCRAISL
jgi:hypothetical protein